MTEKPSIVVNIVLWIFVVMLGFAAAELFFDLKPLGIPVFSAYQTLTFLALATFIFVRLYFVLRQPH